MSRAVWEKLISSQERADGGVRKGSSRAAAIYDSMIPVARHLKDDDSPFQSILAPRRSSKSYSAVALALALCEEKPGARVLIIGLTLKSTKENFWSSAPGGVQAFDTKFGLGLTFSYVDISWKHENGSMGFLAGAETAADIERLRGSKVEADLIIVDECKSFSNGRLVQLVQDILMPGLMTRGGKLILTGTPGTICDGMFYEATRGESDTCAPYLLCKNSEFEGRPAEEGTLKWSFHTWGILDNTSNPSQMKRALMNKALNKWSDDHPTWRREYLAQWIEDNSSLVYSGYSGKAGLQWVPPIGLPEGRDWHFLMGVDLGFEDDFAVTIAGYNDRDDILYHLDEFKSSHLDVDKATEVLKAFERKYGTFESIVVDAGGLGKMIIETFVNRGLNAVAAEKTQKNDYIELMNADFASGKIRIIADSELHHELVALTWDVSAGDKKYLSRVGRLRENKEQPNHLCDAWLYLWRYAWHRSKAEAAPPPKTLDEMYQDELLNYLRRSPTDEPRNAYADHFTTDHLARRGRFN